MLKLKEFRKKIRLYEASLEATQRLRFGSVAEKISWFLSAPIVSLERRARNKLVRESACYEVIMRGLICGETAGVIEASEQLVAPLRKKIRRGKFLAIFALDPTWTLQKINFADDLVEILDQVKALALGAKLRPLSEQEFNSEKWQPLLTRFGGGL